MLDDYYAWRALEKPNEHEAVDEDYDAELKTLMDSPDDWEDVK